MTNPLFVPRELAICEFRTELFAVRHNQLWMRKPVIIIECLINQQTSGLARRFSWVRK